jgi:hypothetical protein
LKRITKVLQLFAVKSNKWPINSVNNLNPISSHEHATVVKWILKIYDANEWTGFLWPRIGMSGRLLIMVP